MSWHLIAHFFGGAFLVNVVPHFVAGVQGARFQSPFAKPPGIGESGPLTNVLWGWINAILAAGLLYYLRPLDLHDGADMAAALLGGVLMSLFVARHMGRVRS